MTESRSKEDGCAWVTGGCKMKRKSLMYVDSSGNSFLLAEQRAELAIMDMMVNGRMLQTDKKFFFES